MLGVVAENNVFSSYYAQMFWKLDPNSC